MKKPLVVFYSFSGQTRALAAAIARCTGGDVRELVPQKAYSFQYNTAAKEARSEIARGYCPALACGNEPIDGYDTVFVGTPNWFKTLAPPVLSFLRAHDFAGKTVVPFCTHGGGGFGEIEQVVARACPGAKMLEGLAAGGVPSDDRIRAWLAAIGWAE